MLWAHSGYQFGLISLMVAEEHEDFNEKTWTHLFENRTMSQPDNGISGQYVHENKRKITPD